jgi:WD40 repeat protein
MNTSRVILFALLACCVAAFEIKDRFLFPPNEFISKLVTNNNYAYALISSSNPAAIYKIDLDSMKIADKLYLPYFMEPSNPILDKAENKLYVVTRNSSSAAITDNLFAIDLYTFQVVSVGYLNAISSLGCDQLFKSGSKFYCINQYQQTCTIIRIDGKTMTPEDTKKQYCITHAMYAPSSLSTPDGQYGYVGYANQPYIVVLPNMTLQTPPISQVQPSLTQKTSPSDGSMCATPDMLTMFMSGNTAAFIRTNVTSNVGNGQYYVEQGRSVTSCFVSPDLKYVFSGYSDGTIRRADALAPSFGSGYTGVLYQLDNDVLGMRILDDRRTVLVWTMHEMLKFDYNSNMKPASAQKLALQFTSKRVGGMTVDREEKFAYVYSFDASDNRNILTFMTKYDLQQQSIVLVVNTTDCVSFSTSPRIYFNANQNRLLVLSGGAFVLNPSDFSTVYINKNVYASDFDSFQDPVTSEIVIARSGGLITFNIDTNTTTQCNVAHPGWEGFKQSIRGPKNQVILSTHEKHPVLALVDYATCSVKMLNFNSSAVAFNGEGTYWNGLYYLLTTSYLTQQSYLITYDVTSGNFNQVASFPPYGIISTQLSFNALNSYVLLPPSFLLDGYIWKLNLQTKQMEQLRLFAAPAASYYNFASNTAYILSLTQPPSIVKISV